MGLIRWLDQMTGEEREAHRRMMREMYPGGREAVAQRLEMLCGLNPHALNLLSQRRDESA